MSIRRARTTIAGAVFLSTLLTSCGSEDYVPPPVILGSTGTNVVAYWHDVGAATVNATAATATTPEEQCPTFQADMATMHLAIYDAISAIDGRYKRFLVTPVTASAGASADAAASAAAYGVLRALFPNRSAQYQAAYESYLATIANGDAKTRGLALGTEVAAAMVANRANDGRSITLPTYVPGSASGKFRGLNPISRFFPAIKLFTLTSAAQFRPAAPPALDSAVSASDLNEVNELGGAVSAKRTADQFETARFQYRSATSFYCQKFRSIRTHDQRPSERGAPDGDHLHRICGCNRCLL